MVAVYQVVSVVSFLFIISLIGGIIYVLSNSVGNGAVSLIERLSDDENYYNPYDTWNDPV